MQVFGAAILLFVIWLGFMDRDMSEVKLFDAHALAIILLGSSGAVLLGSRSKAAWQTLTVLREIVPGLKRMTNETNAMEDERRRIAEHWKAGERARAVDVAEKSRFESSKEIIAVLLRRGADSSALKHFQELRHAEMTLLQPAMLNWELLSKLGPSFGMIGTITGMIQLFRGMGADNANMGAAMSLALTATLYGVAFGAGLAGPIGHYLGGLLDERLGVLDRCEATVKDLVSSLEG
ncbi:MAG: MotA/TolQ/ExbB proton channel family protein [Silvanigrellales bacterium]|jgi:flagellar motor component MotA|nr:MotA/TolQ/ExbB proton channel family protein [Silvanigrellales bacterium]